jgi:putative FmdB family regulatory protein
MPSYEYECQECNKHFTVLVSIAEHDSKRPACPKCKSKKVTQVLASFYAKTVKKS